MAITSWCFLAASAGPPGSPPSEHYRADRANGASGIGYVGLRGKAITFWDDGLR
jgi:hypothetical protein